MSTNIGVSPELMDELFRLPEGVHIVRMDRIPLPGHGQWQWRMYLRSDKDDLPEGECVLFYVVRTADGQPSYERATIQLITTGDVEPTPPDEHTRRRGDAGGSAVSTG